MSGAFVNTSPVYSSSISLTTDNLATEPPNFNTSVETPVFQPRPSIVIFIVWFVAAIIGNCTAVAILIRNRRKHKWTIFYRLVFVLAVTDFTGQVFTIPIILASYSSRDILVTGERLCDFMSWVIITTSVMSILLACLMSIDRAIAVRRPIFYRIKIRISHMYIAIAFVIVIAICVPISGINTHKLQENGIWCFINLQPIEPNDRVILFLCASIGTVAVLLMLITNGLIVWGLCNSYKSKTQSGNQLPAKNLQSICILFIILVTFIVTWMPFIVICFINAVGLSVIGPEKTTLAVKFTVWHQVLNPWIYIILQESIFSRCLEYGRKHSKRGGFFNRIFEDKEPKQQDTSL